MNTIKRLIYFATAILTTVACNTQQTETQQESELIAITSQQFVNDSMQLGHIELRPFENTIKCNGTIIPLPNGMAKVNAPVNGIIKRINCQNGQLVKKNQILAELTGNEIIDIQKEFAEASANYKRLKSEYERIKSLYNEKVTSEKDFMLSESDFKTAMAKYNALKLKIEIIGFSISKIENGEFYSSYSIKSPINGYIASLQTNIGNYIDSQTELFQVINPEMFQIKLSVFANDISALQKGQTVRFKSVNSTATHNATISSVGVTVSNETKSIECYASINDLENITPIANDFIDSEIITNTDTVQTLPNEAIIKTDIGSFILVLNKQENDKYFFNKVEIKTGRQYKGYTEIQNTSITGLIATKGVYNISL